MRVKVVAHRGLDAVRQAASAGRVAATGRVAAMRRWGHEGVRSVAARAAGADPAAPDLPHASAEVIDREFGGWLRTFRGNAVLALLLGAAAAFLAAWVSDFPLVAAGEALVPSSLWRAFADWVEPEVSAGFALGTAAFVVPTLVALWGMGPVTDKASALRALTVVPMMATLAVLTVAATIAMTAAGWATAWHRALRLRRIDEQMARIRGRHLRVAGFDIDAAPAAVPEPARVRAVKLLASAAVFALMATLVLVAAHAFGPAPDGGAVLRWVVWLAVVSAAVAVLGYQSAVAPRVTRIPRARSWAARYLVVLTAVLAVAVLASGATGAEDRGEVAVLCGFFYLVAVPMVVLDAAKP